LHAEDIIRRAQDRAGLDHFDSPSFRPGLEIALASLYGKKTRRPESTAWFEGQFVALLAERLKVADYISRHPAILEKPVAAPIVVIGLPRTGSTLLSNLLGTDGNLRPLLRWEAGDLVPPATQKTLKTDPRCLALIEAERAQSTNHLPNMHYEPWDGPTECHAILSQDFKSAGLEPGLASMDYGLWLLECDAASAYAYHRMVLQMLQSHTTGRWSLKLPSHALNIRALMAAYPDARIVWTHRDPYRVAGSFLSMMAAAQKLHLTEIDRDYLTRYYPERLRQHVARPMAVQDESAADPFYHLFYSDLVGDPLGQMRKLYAWAGQIFTPQTEAGMSAWLAANPQGKFGRHDYGLAEYGFSVESLKPFFDDYVRRFDPEPEI
jgi:hypothetical protein